jgi:Tfp pilus assembly PilM family ATPase
MSSVLNRVMHLVRPGGGRRFVAIDFDSRWLRMVQAERVGDRLRILKLASFAVPGDLDVSDVQALGGFLGQCVQACSWRGASVLMSVPRGQAVLKPVILPPNVRPREVAGMVQYQMETELPFAPDAAVIDFTMESHYGAAGLPEEAATPGVNVLVAAVQRPMVDHYRRLAEIAGVRLQRLGLRPYADGRCVEACTVRRAQECVAVVHVTADDTEIDILTDGVMVFSRSAVAKVPPVGREEDPAVDQAIETVAAEVARSLRSYQAVQGGRRIDTLLVAGGTGIEPRVAADLARRLDLPCRMFSPAAALGLETGDQDTSAFISALGLAIGHAGVAELPFDFLHPKRPPVQRDRKKVLAAVIGSAAALAVIAGVAVGGTYLQAKKSRIDALTQQLRDLEQKNKQVAAVAKPVNAVDTWLQGGRPWLDHWACLSGAFPSCTDAYVTSISATQDGVLSFNVKARSSEAITELGHRLGEAGYGFKPGQVTTRGDPLGYTFNVGMKVLVKPDLKVDLAGVKYEPRPVDEAPASPPEKGRSSERPARSSSSSSGDSPAEQPTKSTSASSSDSPAEAPAEKAPTKSRRSRRSTPPAEGAPSGAESERHSHE